MALIIEVFVFVTVGIPLIVGSIWWSALWWVSVIKFVSVRFGRRRLGVYRP